MRTLLYDLWEKLADWFTALPHARWLLHYKIIVGGISVWLIICSIILIVKTGALFKVGELVDIFRAPREQKRIEKKWQKILEELEGREGATWKLAVIEADNIFGSILKRMGLPGKDMGERLANVRPETLKGLDGVWQAHKLRNRIVHEDGLHLTRGEAERAVENIQSALKELGVL